MMGYVDTTDEAIGLIRGGSLLTTWIAISKFWGQFHTMSAQCSSWKEINNVPAALVTQLEREVFWDDLLHLQK
jgi:hypothetical protein